MGSTCGDGGGGVTATSFTTGEVLARLEILWRKLEDEGRYVSANTVSLAIDEIKRLTDEVDHCRPKPSTAGSLR